VCLLYFIVAGVAVLLDWLSSTKYVVIGGIVGGVASVLSLISLARPTLNREDLGNLEVQSLKRIAETSEQIQKLEVARIETEQEIGNLEARKKQMEFLVQKASLSLFLQEQKRLYEKRINEELDKNKDLANHLYELSSIEKKLVALDEEIQKDPNVNLLQKVIRSARRTPQPEREPFSEFPPLTRAFLLALRDILLLLSKILKK
jgi:hypothetical protein